MAKVAPYHSINDAKKPPEKRDYHNNDACPRGRNIPKHERRDGTGGYGLCNDCASRDMADEMSDKAREEAPILERRR